MVVLPLLTRDVDSLPKVPTTYQIHMHQKKFDFQIYLVGVYEISNCFPSCHCIKTHHLRNQQKKALPIYFLHTFLRNDLSFLTLLSTQRAQMRQHFSSEY